MDKEYQLLLNLCAHCLDGEEFTLEWDRSTNFKKLFKHAKVHNLLGIVYCAVAKMKNRDELPADFLEAIKNLKSQKILCTT